MRFTVVAQALYVIWLIMGFVYFLRTSPAKHWLSFFLLMAMLLTVLPHIITEAQPRYHHGLSGFLAAAAGCGIYESIKGILKTGQRDVVRESSKPGGVVHKMPGIR